MTTTMREKAIEAALGAIDSTGEIHLSRFTAQKALDAILDTLREPDEGMIEAGPVR